MLCNACGTGQRTCFFVKSDALINCVSLCKTPLSALRCPTGKIQLGVCKHCGAISNMAFDPERVVYDASYDNSLHFSLRFQSYADELARHLITAYELRGKHISEIGCGNGEFLAQLCELGANRGTGFDPSFIAGRADTSVSKGITIVRDYFPQSHAQHRADFIVCRQVLEHIPKPQWFLRCVRAALLGRSPGAVFVEVPNARFIFQNSRIWDIIYEHCFYYTPESLIRLFEASGFEVLEVAETFDHQYLCLEARTLSRKAAVLSCATAWKTALECDILRFTSKYRDSWRYWKRTLSHYAAESKRVVLWGAGAKGSMFLNAFRDIAPLKYVVDVNPYKWGLYVPGAGHKVVSPEVLKTYRPEVVLIANSVYHREISSELSAMGISSELVDI